MELGGSKSEGCLMKISEGIRKCLNCFKTYGREFEKGKCPFCGSFNNISVVKE